LVVLYNKSYQDSQIVAASVTYPTSFAELLIYGKLKRGEYVLVHAGAGAVGTNAIQISKEFGASLVIATAGEQKKKV
jgi:NADPH2:quinone reductase